MGETQLLERPNEAPIAASPQECLENSLSVLVNLQNGNQLATLDTEYASKSFGEDLGNSVPDGELIEDHLNYYKTEGLVLDEAQERIIVDNAEFEKYGEDKYIDRTIQRSVINTIVREAALRRISGGELDDEFINDMQIRTMQSVGQLTDFLYEKNAGSLAVSNAKIKADEYLQKTIQHYTNHDVLDPNPETKKTHTIERLRGLGRGLLDKAAETSSSLVDKLLPSRRAVKRTGRFVLATGALSVTFVTLMVAGEMSVDPKDDDIEESVVIDDLNVIAANTVATVSDILPTETTIPEIITLGTTASETEDITEVVNEAEPVGMATAPAATQPERPPLTPEEQAIVDQKQKTLLEIVADGEQTLEGLAGNLVGSLEIPGICLDDIDVFVTNAVDPVNNPGILDGFDWDTINSDPNLPPVAVGDYVAARERINPLYRARIDATPQEPCIMEGQSDYTERWLRPVKGALEAKTIATHPSELAPAATIHPFSSLPGQPGVTLVEAHRTTGPAAFVNVDALLPGQTAEFSDGDTDFSYDFVEFMEVSPDISIDEVRAMYAGDDDVLILSSCDDGSAIRLLSVFRRNV